MGSNGTNNIDDNNKYKLNSINKKNNIIEPLTIINKHKGPVKALAWSPWQRNVLATGGGKKIMS